MDTTLFIIVCIAMGTVFSLPAIAVLFIYQHDTQKKKILFLTISTLQAITFTAFFSYIMFVAGGLK